MSTKLFTPYDIDTLTLPNRIVVPPMCMYSAQDGHATDWHLIHYGSLALSGAGLIIWEATGVVPEGRITPWCLGIWDDQTADALADKVKRIRAYSNIPMGLQLAHAGAKASTNYPWVADEKYIPENEGGWQCVSPSGLPYDETRPDPIALDQDGVYKVIDAYQQAALRAHKAGFDLVEIHAAHGYLLHEFLSPLSNKRTDMYGGSFENRIRLVLEVFEAVRAAFPSGKPVGIRLSATDWVEGGWTPEETVDLVRLLKDKGCSFADISSAGLSPLQKIRVGSGFQIPFAHKVKQETGMTIIGVGLITEAETAESVIATEQADLVAIGRAMLFDPRWPWHAAKNLGAKTVLAAPQYLRSAPYGVTPRDFLQPLGKGE